MPRKPSIQFLAGMGSKECTSKDCNYFKEGLLSEFQISISIDKLSCNKEQVFRSGETTVFDKVGLSNDRQKAITPVQNIDLSVVNKYLHVPTFKMETAENIRDSLQQGEWVTSLNLTDAYFHIPLQ